MSENKTNSGKKPNFLKGALILAVANFIVKIIGAMFKIPLFRLIGDDGSGYFNVAYQIYTFMFIVATAGFPVAVSKMVSESLVNESESCANRVFKVAFRFLAVVGLIGTLIMIVFSDALANLVAIKGSSVGIMVIAPSVFFVSLASAYRGYFQGRQNMYPTALSEVVESTTKMLVGLIAAGWIMGMTVDGSLGQTIDLAAHKIASAHIQTIFASSGAIFGVTFGTLLSCLILSIIYIVHSRRKRELFRLPVKANGRTILKKLIMIAIPITIGASVSSLTTLIDMATISRRLVINPDVFERYSFMFAPGTDFYKKVIEEGWQGAELLSQKAATLYGMYTGKALTMFNLPLTLVVALGTSVVPAISAAVAAAKSREAKNITEGTLRIAMLFAAPCAIGMAVLSEPILMLLFGTGNAKSVLSILSISIIPVAIVQVSNSILQSYGRVYKPVTHMIIGGAIKVVVNFFCIPYLGIDGAPVGTFVCYLTIAVLNTISIIRTAKIDFKWNSFVIRPLLAALVMGVAAFGLLKVLPGGNLICLIQIAICGVVYLIAALAFGTIKKEDVLMLPSGEKIAALMLKYKLLK